MAPTGTGAPVSFFNAPRQYVQWAARAKPAIFWSVIVGCLGPVAMLVVPPIRYRLGDNKRPQIPLTYPIPKGPRNIPKGYDD